MEKKFFRLKPLSRFILTAMATASLISFAENALVSANPAPQNFSLLPPTAWLPRATLNGQYGNYSYGQADLFYPFMKRADGIVFLDLRATSTAQDAQEYNLGIGYRRIIPRQNPFILGGYIWADRRHSRYGDFFNQATLGCEYLSMQYDVRANMYVPYGKHSALISEQTNPFITGYTIGYTLDQQIQDALHGADIEVGKVDLFDRHLRVYGDYYHFGTGSDDVRMNGGRARLEYIVENRWLTAMHSNLILTASYQYDNVRHSTGLAGFRLNIGEDYKPMGPLVGRMEEYIMRDDDIVIVKHDKSTRFTDPNRYIFVNDTAGPDRDGTFEHPFKTATDAENFSRPGDTIYTFKASGHYFLPLGGLNLKPNQTFLGSGTALTFANVIVLPATASPIFVGRINVANNDKLGGFILSGQGAHESVGIYGNHVHGLELYNLTVQDFSGANADGVDAVSTTGNAYGSSGGEGGDVKGIDLENSVNVQLTNVMVKHIVGGHANGGSADASGAESGDVNIAHGGDGGEGGNAIGIYLSGDSNINLNHVIVTDVRGGAANGGSAKVNSGIATLSDNLSYGGDGGQGGAALGIDLTDVRGNLTNVKIDHIVGNSANGGDTTAIGNTDVYSAALGGRAFAGGAAIGISVNHANVNLTGLIVSNVKGGVANGGDAKIYSNSANSYAFGGDGGSGGQSIGLYLTDTGQAVASFITITQINGGHTISGAALIDSQGTQNRARSGYSGYGSQASGIVNAGKLNLINATVTNINGGFAQSGDATALHGQYNAGVGRAVNFLGDKNAYGIDSAGSLSLKNVLIANINGGASLGGDGSAIGDIGTENRGYGSSAFSHAGMATGLNLNSADVLLNNIIIGEIHGGDVVGGSAIGSTAAFGGTALFGGDGIGINQNGHSINTASVIFATSTITGGTAMGGAPQSIPGTQGTAQNIKP